MTALLFCSATAHAQLDVIKLPDWLLSAKLSGDLRMREDNSFNRGPAANGIDVDRRRFRARYGGEFELPYNLYINLRLASGAGAATSENQTMGQLSSEKGVWFDTAYVRWAPQMFETGSWYAQSGRMNNTLWRANSSDLVWSEDFNPEGFAEGGEMLLPGTGVNLFANMLQIDAQQSAVTVTNVWDTSWQAGAETKLPGDTRLRAAAAYHKWSGLTKMATGVVGPLDGNSRAASGALLNDFGVGEVTAQYSGWVAGLPISLQGTVARNYLASVSQHDGYQYGFVVGKAEAKNTVEAAWFYKYSENDCTVADVTDSNFGSNGGTNRRGHIFWVAYSPENWMQLKAKGYITEMLDPSLSASGDKASNHFMLDLLLKF